MGRYKASDLSHALPAYTSGGDRGDVIFDPVSIDDVNVIMTGNSNDLGTLCTKDDSINFWAKYRPGAYGTISDRPTMVINQGTQYEEVVPNFRLNYGFSYMSGNTEYDRNINIQIYVDSNGVYHINSVNGSTDLTWNTTNISPWYEGLPDSKKFYRLTDFNNYWHTATCPYLDTSPSGNIVYNDYNTILSFTPIHSGLEDGSGNRLYLTLNDILFANSSTPYSPYYFGLLIKKTRSGNSSFYLLKTGCNLTVSGSYTNTGVQIFYENDAFTIVCNLSLFKDSNDNNIFLENDSINVRLVLTSAGYGIYNVPTGGDQSGAYSFTLQDGFCVRSTNLIKDYSYVSRTILRANITSSYANVYLKKITDTSIINAIKALDPALSQMGNVRVCQVIFDAYGSSNCIKAGIKVRVDNVHWASDDQRNYMTFNERYLKLDVKNQNGTVIGGENKWIAINTNTIYNFLPSTDVFIGTNETDNVTKSNGVINCCGGTGNTSNLPIIFNSSFNSNDIFAGSININGNIHSINDDDIYIVCPSDFDSDTNTITMKYYVDDQLIDTEWLDVNN